MNKSILKFVVAAVGGITLTLVAPAPAQNSPCKNMSGSDACSVIGMPCLFVPPSASCQQYKMEFPERGPNHPTEFHDIRTGADRNVHCGFLWLGAWNGRTGTCGGCITPKRQYRAGGYAVQQCVPA